MKTLNLITHMSEAREGLFGGPDPRGGRFELALEDVELHRRLEVGSGPVLMRLTADVLHAVTEGTALSLNLGEGLLDVVFEVLLDLAEE